MTQKPEYGIDLPQCMAERGELETEVAMDRLMEWVEDSDPVEARVRRDARRGRIQ